jgi:hypothetical protein
MKILVAIAKGFNDAHLTKYLDPPFGVSDYIKIGGVG